MLSLVQCADGQGKKNEYSNIYGTEYRRGRNSEMKIMTMYLKLQNDPNILYCGVIRREHFTIPE